MKLCIHCKNFEAGGRTGGHECKAWSENTHPVFGTPIRSITADFARAVLCGWDEPKRFEPMTKDE